jgi:glycine cleavage system transcriptional repressor
VNRWYMMTLVGADQPGIVARVTRALFEGGCNLGEATALRLGANFSIMLMVSFAGEAAALEALAAPVAEELQLHLHVDAIRGELHADLEPDVRITVHGADRPGIVAQVTGALAEAGLNIVALDSDVAGNAQKPIYVMNIEGQATRGVEALRRALDAVTRLGIDAKLSRVESLVG